MVKTVSTLTSSGLKNWLIQNFSAFFMFIYIVGLVIYLMIKPIQDFSDWQLFIHLTFMKIASLLFLFFVIIHTRLGLWMIATDYLKNTIIRIGFLMISSLVLIGSFLWAVSIMWGA